MKKNLFRDFAPKKNLLRIRFFAEKINNLWISNRCGDAKFYVSATVQICSNTGLTLVQLCSNSAPTL